MDNKTLSQLKKESDYIESDVIKEIKAEFKDKIELKTALKREYNSKKLYWESQERKAKQFIESLEEKIAEVKHHLAHIVDFAINYFKNLKTKIKYSLHSSNSATN